MKLKDNENFVVLGIFLGVISLLSALILAVVSQLTSGAIAEAKIRRENNALRQVLPGFDNPVNEKILKIQSPAKWTVELRAAKNKGRIVGYAAAAVNPRGYAGNIKMLAGLNPDGTVRAILITEQKETPGLGAEICKREFRKTIFNFTQPPPPGLPPNKYLDQFNGKKIPAGGWKITKDGGTALYATGATVTSRAVARAASEIVLAFRSSRKKITDTFGGAE